MVPPSPETAHGTSVLPGERSGVRRDPSGSTLYPRVVPSRSLARRMRYPVAPAVRAADARLVADRDGVARAGVAAVVGTPRQRIADRSTGMRGEVRRAERGLRAGLQDEVHAHPTAAAGEHGAGEDTGGDRRGREDAKRFHDALLPSV